MRDEDSGTVAISKGAATATATTTTAAAVARQLHGQVLYANGTPAAGAEVTVMTKQLRCADAPLGATKAAIDGQFAIGYETATIRANVYVRAKVGDDVAVSPVIINAGLDETVELILGGTYVGPSDLTRVTAAIADVLAEECAKPDELATFTEDEIALLAATSGVEPAELVLLRQALALGAETSRSPALFYALGKQRVPLSLVSVLATDPVKRREAVAAALAANQVPAALADALEVELSALDDLSVSEALRAPTLPSKSTLGSLLAAAALDPTKRAALTSAYVAHDGTIEAFWTSVRGSVLTNDEVTRVQHVLRLGAVTLNHVPLVEVLRAEPGHDTLEGVASLEKADWQARVTTTGMPPDLQAAGLTTDEYVDRIHAIVEDVVPTAYLAARAARLPEPGSMAQFFARNPEFEIRSTPVAAFLRSKPPALDFLPDDEAKARFTRVLKTVERLWRIAPPGTRFETMQMLLKRELDSAQKIRSLGRSAFLRRYGADFGIERAQRIFARASHAAAVATTLVARHGAAFDGTPMAVLPARVDALTRFPDYATLFGSVDSCSCVHCQSVLSPAAYLTDVLHWLDGRDATVAWRALDVLLDPARRPDLGTIELSCPNTNTPLPQIDLVNELLELAVSPPDGGVPYQTTGTAEDLRVQPEHQHAPAYHVLANTAPLQPSVYPFGLPYNLWLDEARTFLGALGLPRHALMEALHTGSPDAILNDPSVGAEVLGLSPTEWDVIAGKPLTPALPMSQYWGLIDSPTWFATLSNVATLLGRAAPTGEAAMAYDELEDLLRTDFVQQPGQELGLSFAGPSCDTTTATLVGLTEAHLDRIHRFVRLRRRLGWSAATLDRAITVLGGGALAEATLLQIASVRRLAAQLGTVSVDDILGWSGPFDTRRWQRRLRGAASGTGKVFTRALAPVAAEGDDQSPYDRRFLTRSIGTAPAPALYVGPDGTTLLDETQPLANHATAVAAALGVTADELARLSETLPDALLSLANLSRLARQASLARALGLSIAELRTLQVLIGLDATAPVLPRLALLLLEEVRALRASGVSLDELAYLLRHVDTQPAALAPSETAIGVFVLELRDALRRASTNPPDTDPPDDAARRQALRSVVVDKLSAALGIAPAITAALIEQYVRSPDAAAALALDVYLDPAVVGYHGTDPATGAPVPPTPVDLPAAFATYVRLHMVALLITRLNISADEVAWVFGRAPADGSLDVNTLPVRTDAPASGYPGWRTLATVIALRNGVPGRQLFDLFERAAVVAEGGDPTAIAEAHEALLEALERRTRWPRADLEFLIGTPARGSEPPRPSALGLTYPTDWRSARGFYRLDRAMRAILRVGLAAETLWPWRQIPLGPDEQDAQAKAIQQAVRARFADAQWRAIATPLRDGLRERQRDALVAWLVAHHDDFHDADDLYGHFLIDVQISACQLTSRIRQAMSSAQQFVQRALLNLEPEVALTVDDAREWTWMKTYRVWEANRKVFLYPENWIDPALRDDKTPLYRELEDELSQREVTAEAAERAVVGYLERLDELARLEVMAILHQQDDDGDVLHVVARTRNTPARYFYRQRQRGVRWTPWERIDVDVEGEHVLLATFQRRLYLFWAQITEAAKNDVPGPVAPGATVRPTKPVGYYQIRLGWTQQRDGRWTGRTLSTVQVGATDADFGRQPLALGKSDDSTKADFFFRTFEDASGDLLVETIRRVKDSRDHRDNPRYIFVPADRFRLSGCDGTMTLDAQAGEFSIAIREPVGTRTWNQRFATLSAGAALSLPAQNPSTSAYDNVRTLGHMDGGFQVVPDRLDDFHSEDVFFVQDRRRTFLVAPHPRPWLRTAPGWRIPDGIAVDPLRLYPETNRPPVPRPDGWRLDPAGTTSGPALIRTKSPPALVSVSGTPASGLPAAGTAALAETFGARVQYVGAEAVTPRSEAVALLGHTQLLSAKGDVLMTVRSSGLPAAADGLHVVTLESSATLPALSVADPFSGVVLKTGTAMRYRFETFYHPYVCRFLRQVHGAGLDGLYDPPKGDLLRRQQLADPFFASAYAPVAVNGPQPRDEIDFTYGGAYSAYNWEVFFHVPFAIASWLSENQRFAEAQRWFHYIFDPTESDRELPWPQRVWKLKPFFELFHGEDIEAGPIHELLLLLQYDGTDPAKLAVRDQVLAQIDAWGDAPFQPHAIARLRLVAYQKAVVMKYLDNLLAWGDHLFRQDTMESVNEAAQLYVLAAQILGRRPVEVSVEPPKPRTFNELRNLHLDELGNALIEDIEGYLPDMGDPPDDADGVPVLGPSLFFCVPRNDRLLTAYWDRVADRLFKVRHCMNLAGATRQLALFEPPIDPGLLVRAAAAGIDLASALRDVSAPLPIHRYPVLIAKASELCAEVRALGQSLLAALEKQDAEALSLLRAGHEVKLLGSMRQVRERQVQEAKETVEGLRRAREAAQIRLQYYRGRSFMNAAEKTHQRLSSAAGALDALASITHDAASIAMGVPDLQLGSAGAGGSPFITGSYGGSKLAGVLVSVASHLEVLARHSDRAASVAATLASYQRRQDEWSFQGDVAQKDLEALDRQLLAGQIRVAIAERELTNLDLQVTQSKEVDEHLRTKYTNAELYRWMVGQLSSLYFQSYQLAYEVAKRAERAWQFELAAPEASFIQFGYWDSLKKGLLAGERLAHDLRRMEVAYLDQHRREYELTHHVSLRTLDPVALESLRTEGQCFVRIPEVWFDLDSPGHYLRRLKNVALSIPSVTGSYVPIRCTLTLMASSVRTSADATGAYPRAGANDPRFRDNVVGSQSIVTSRGQEDGGLFETNLRDERYLPFEGAGAISEWRLELPKQFRQFDYSSIGDVVLHLRYTARDGGETFRGVAQEAIAQTLQSIVLASQDERPAGQREGLFHLVSLREQVTDAWDRFLAPEPDQTGQTVIVPLAKAQLPEALNDDAITVTGLDVFLPVVDHAGYRTGTPVRLVLTSPGGTGTAVDLVSTVEAFDGVPHAVVSLTGGGTLGDWMVEFREEDNAAASGTVIVEQDGHRRLAASAVQDLIIAVRYRVGS